MIRQSAYAFSNEPPHPADDRSGEGDASAMQLREELSEFLAETMHRLESLTDALMHCQVATTADATPAPQGTPAIEVPLATEPTTARYETTRGQEAIQGPQANPTPSTQSRETPAPQQDAVTTAPDLVWPSEPTTAAAIDPNTTNALPEDIRPAIAADTQSSRVVGPGPEAAGPSPVPEAPAPLPVTIDEVSAAGGDSPASPTPNFSADNSNPRPTNSSPLPTNSSSVSGEPAADPADRLAAIKLRLAKQIENA